MIPVKSITIMRAEGPISLATKKAEFDSFNKANAHIWCYASTYPKMGYDKHDVTVMWEDGTEYSLRLDCQHPDNKYFDGNEIDKRIHRGIKYWLENKKDLDKSDIKLLEHIANNCDLNGYKI